MPQPNPTSQQPSVSRPSTVASTTSSGNKLPKFLHRNHHHRDRSRSFADGPYSSSAESEDSTPSSSSRTARSATRKSSKLFGGNTSRDKDPQRMNPSPTQSSHTDNDIQTPTIIEPPPPAKEPPASQEHGRTLVSRSRTISTNRPMSLSTLDAYSRLRANGGSPNRLADISGRFSGWIQQAFSSSSTDLSIPSSASAPLSSQTQARTLTSSSSAVTASSKTQKLRAGSPASSIMSHMPGKANLERAVRWVLDPDVAQPDRCTDPIWIMGVEHPGYEPTPPAIPVRGLTPIHSHDSTDSGTSARPSPPPSNSIPPASTASAPTLHISSPAVKPTVPREITWPPAFHDDFTSRIWLTYRSHFAPIRDGALSNLEPPISLDECSPLPRDFPEDFWEKSANMLSASPPKPRWAWGGEKTWTSDTGWGCMLRTGQSVLAEALVHLHLTRNWRRSRNPTTTQEYATYVKIVSWFFDTPSPLAPFGVHRMALAGKALGTDVGSWFGPSTAAGAIKTLVNAFPEAGLSAAVAVDGTLYETDVYAASNVHPQREVSAVASLSSGLSSGLSRRGKTTRRKWGGQAVLVLVGVRLGIDSVNPVYHDSVKKLFTLPQSVGIAGGRPSSSYYFIGYQADHLFYLDPHHTRPAVALQPLRDAFSLSQESIDASPSVPSSNHRHRRREAAASTPCDGVSNPGDELFTRHNSASRPAAYKGDISSPSQSTSTIALDTVAHSYATAYSPADLRTYHCDRIRKMPVSSLDPSMLLAFLCRDEADWKNLRARITELSPSRAIFSIQDEPPSYGDDSDSDVGIQSVSEPGSELSSDERTFESTEADIVELSDAVPEEPEVEFETPPPAQHPPNHFPFPGSTAGDADDDWVTPPTPPMASFPRRIHLRSQSLAAPTIRPQPVAASSAPSR